MVSMPEETPQTTPVWQHRGIKTDLLKGQRFSQEAVWDVRMKRLLTQAFLTYWLSHRHITKIVDIETLDQLIFWHREFWKRREEVDVARSNYKNIQTNKKIYNRHTFTNVTSSTNKHNRQT